MKIVELRTDELDGRTRYQLLTSIVVPRPIGWMSTYGRDRTPNLAPFSYYGALSASPMLVGVSVGHRTGGIKDTGANIRATGAFCANIVTEAQLDAMNATSGDHAPHVDEFVVADLPMEDATSVDAPFVATCPVVMECELFQEVGLGNAPNTLFVGRVVRIRLDEDLPMVEGTHFLRPEALRPVARLWGPTYATLGEIRSIPRPSV